METENYMPKVNSIFKEEILDYINFKRNLGYKYSKRICSIYEILDRAFIEMELKEKRIDYNVIDYWYSKCSSLKQKTKDAYYSTIKMFCEYLILKHYSNVVMPTDNPFKGTSDFVPYIYSYEEINNIFNYVISKKNSKKNYVILHISLCLLYGCGLRISELTNLKLKHFDKNEKTILIENSKNNVTRLIPLSKSIYNNLIQYIKINNIENPDYYIIENDNKRCNVNNNIRWNFRQTLKAVGIKKLESGFFPRIHDFRHTFAVNALKQMQTKGFDLYTSLPILSVYLGHKSIAETEYYLRLVKDDFKEIVNNKSYNKNLYRNDEAYYE